MRVYCIHPSKLPVLPVAFWRMMENGKNALRRQGICRTGHQLHCLFAIILLHCHPTQPHVLWDLNKVNLCDDLHHKLITHSHLNPTDEDVLNYGLYLIQDITIRSDGKCLSDIQDMYTPQQQ